MPYATHEPPPVPPLPPMPPPPPPPPMVGPSIRDDFFDFSEAPSGWSFGVWTGEGDDMVIGSSGNDTIDGGPDHDILIGGPGHDLVLGGSGDDLVIGGRGADSLSGGSGNDKIVFGVDDTVRGGPGADEFVFRFDNLGDGEHGRARVLDFNPWEGDSFYFENPSYGDSFYSLPNVEMVYGVDSGNAVAVLGVGSAFWDDLKG